MTGRVGAVTRVGVGTKWRAANSGDHSDNLVTAPQTGRENKLPWRPAPGACWLGTTNARFSRSSMTCACCEMRRTALRTSSPRLTRCGRTAGSPASSPKPKRR